MFNIVYITTCLINNKKYVGSHLTKKIEDGYLGSGKLFTKALKKYGSDNFSREIIEFCDSINDARRLEEKYISENNTLFPYGYNLSKVGGANLCGNKLTEDHKKKISEGFVGMTGKNHSDKTKLKMRLSKLGKGTSRKGIGHKNQLIQKYGEENGLKRYEIFIEKQRNAKINKTLSEDHKKKIKNSCKGINRGPKSIETRLKISETLKNKKLNSNL